MLALAIEVASCYLLDPDGRPVPTTPTITKIDPVNGAIQIAVSRSDTALDPGRYTDALQVIDGALKDIFWIGQIRVAANPFSLGF